MSGYKTDFDVEEDGDNSDENYTEEYDDVLEDDMIENNTDIEETKAICVSSSNETEDKTPRQKHSVQNNEKTTHEYLADDEEDSNSLYDEDDCVDVLEYTKTEDQSGNSLTEAQFLAMKETVLGIQNSVALVANVDHDALCKDCGGRTFLPREFLNSIKKPLCDNCLVSQSGHSNCEIESCAICIQLATEMSERAEISELFAKGLLMYSPGEAGEEVLSKEPIKTEYVDYETVESPKDYRSANKKKRFLLKRN